LTISSAACNQELPLQILAAIILLGYDSVYSKNQGKQSKSHAQQQMELKLNYPTNSGKVSHFHSFHISGTNSYKTAKPENIIITLYIFT
jgi:hypothetical protein